MSTIDALKKIFNRDLDALAKDISLYPTEESLWQLQGDIKNTAGNLCLHLCGNLQHFIGAVLGRSGYVRNRDAEFVDKNVPQEKLLAEIEATKRAVSQTLAKLDVADLQKEYPIQVFGEPLTTEYFLIHLSGHLMYHRGQINYHRRILTSGRFVKTRTLEEG